MDFITVIVVAIVAFWYALNVLFTHTQTYFVPPNVNKVR